MVLHGYLVPPLLLFGPIILSKIDFVFRNNKDVKGILTQTFLMTAVLPYTIFI